MSAGPLARFKRLLNTTANRDGRSEAVERPAKPKIIAAAIAEPAPDTERRDRGFWLPQELLDRCLAQKVMDGWLQNRHQVLLPLTFRLGRLGAEHIDVLMRFTATVVLIGSAADARDVDSAEHWLGEVGAGERGIAVFRAALSTPQPLSDTLRVVRDAGLEPYAYAAAVAVANTREPAGHLFANFIAARFTLPADAIRSIDRRYRR